MTDSLTNYDRSSMRRLLLARRPCRQQCNRIAHRQDTGEIGRQGAAALPPPFLALGSHRREARWCWLRITLFSTLILIWAGIAHAAPAFPVKYSADKHYLTDQ